MPDILTVSVILFAIYCASWALYFCRVGQASPSQVKSVVVKNNSPPKEESVAIEEFVINLNAKSPKIIQWIMKGYFFHSVPKINEKILVEVRDEMNSIFFGDKVKSDIERKSDSVLVLLEEADKLLNSGDKKHARKYIRAIELIVEDLKDTPRYTEMKEALEEIYDRMHRK